eukprot:scaffold244253_cov31-Tisochrysis_lutea.AAC.1
MQICFGLTTLAVVTHLPGAKGPEVVGGLRHLREYEDSGTMIGTNQGARHRRPQGCRQWASRSTFAWRTVFEKSCTTRRPKGSASAHTSR